MASTVNDSTSEVRTCGGYPPLCGRYKVFFRPEAHATVSKFYHQGADHTQRQNFKRLVKNILAFDVAEAKKKVRIGFNLDIPGANAVVRANGGELMAPEAKEQAVYYVASAPPREKQVFRQTMGLIVPPSLTCLHRSQISMDFGEDRKYMKGELMHRNASKDVVGKQQLNMPSAPVEAKCEVIGDGKSQYGLFYAWKVAPKLSTNATQRAHDTSVKGAPWGQYGSSEKSRWKTHMKEDMEEREYGTPATFTETAPNGDTLQQSRLPKRRFQNYNDNVTHEMYRTQRLLRKGRELPGTKLATVTEAARQSPDIMQPERAPARTGETMSPIFCR